MMHSNLIAEDMKMAIQTIRAHKVRSFLTVLGVVIGVSVAIIVSSIVYALLAQKTMVQLLTVYVWLRIGVTVLTVLSSWRLRTTNPDLARPFRIP